MLETNKIYNQDCLEGLKLLDDNSVDSIVTDPPYGLGFMGKAWDNFRNSKTNEAPVYKKGLLKTQGKSKAPWLTDKFREENVNFQKFCEEWARQCLRVLKPGGHLLSFGGTRTYHRMACAIEDAGFEIRDQMQWIYGSGFPKSHNISKALDKKAGATREVVGERITGRAEKRNANEGFESGQMKIDVTVPATDEAKQWDGWGTCLKPANEPIVVARKPLSEKTIADNVLKWGTGGLNIDDCRVEFAKKDDPRIGKDYKHKAKAGLENGNHKDNSSGVEQLLHNPQGRFPANIIFDEEAGKMLDEQSGVLKSGGGKKGNVKPQTGMFGNGKAFESSEYKANSGGASRFFYCAKASKKERGEGNPHPTIKPLSLIKYLITLVTPPNGVCLDPFEGSGTHALACEELGFNYIGFELDDTYYNLADKRIEEHIKSKNMIK